MKKIFLFLSVMVVAVFFCLSSCRKPNPEDEPVIPETGEYPMLGPDAGIMSGITVSMEPIPIAAPQISNGFTVSGLAEEIALGVGRGMLSYAGSRLASYIMSLVEPSSGPEKEMMETLQNISKQVDAIQGQLTGISNQLVEILDELTDISEDVKVIRDMMAAKIYTDYRKDLIAISNLNMEYYEQVEDAAYDTARLTQILEAWAKESVNGSSARLAAKNLADLLVDGSMSSADPCKIYDMIVFNTLPWESQGYDLRDEFRAADALILLRGLQLSYMYYLYTNNESMATSIANTTNKLAKYYETHPVVRSNDMAICQIRGAHVKLSKKISDISYFKLNAPAYLTGKQMVAAHAYGENISVPTEQQVNVFSQQILSIKELQAIMSCYMSTSKKDKSLLAVLKEDASVTCTMENVKYMFMPIQNFNAVCTDIMSWLTPCTIVQYTGMVDVQQAMLRKILDLSTGLFVDKLLEPQSVNVLEAPFESMETADKYDIRTEHVDHNTYELGSYRKWKLPNDNMSFTFTNKVSYILEGPSKLVWLKVESRY